MSDCPCNWNYCWIAGFAILIFWLLIFRNMHYSLNLTLRSISIWFNSTLCWLICCFLEGNMRHFQRKFVLSMVMRTLSVCAWQIWISLWWIYLRIRTCGYLNDAVFFSLHCHCHCPRRLLWWSRGMEIHTLLLLIIVQWIISHNGRPSYGLPEGDTQMWCSCSCPPGRTKRRQMW